MATNLQLGSWRKREFCQQGWDREPVTIYWNNIFIDDNVYEMNADVQYNDVQCDVNRV